MRERVRRASSAFERDHRKVRALRILFARLPHLRAVGAGNGFAARPHLPDEDGERGLRRIEFDLGEPLRQLPGLYGLRDGVPFRRGVRKTHRGYARADRTKDGTSPRRKAAPAIYVRDFYAAGALAANALAAACLSKIRIAGRLARLRFAEVVAEEGSDDGGTTSEAWAAGSGRGSDTGDGNEAPPRWSAPWLCAEGILLASQCGHGARS